MYFPVLYCCWALGQFPMGLLEIMLPSTFLYILVEGSICFYLIYTWEWNTIEYAYVQSSDNVSSSSFPKSLCQFASLPMCESCDWARPCQQGCGLCDMFLVNYFKGTSRHHTVSPINTSVCIQQIRLLKNIQCYYPT